MTKNRPNEYKLSIVGEAGVGKSSIVERVVRDRFLGVTTSTIGAAYSTYKFGASDSIYQIWDTAGQERYKALIPMYLRDSKIVLIVYDITNIHSVRRIKEHWYDFVKDNVDEECYIMLIGNKWDIHRQHTDHIEQEGRELASMFELPHIQVSAKDGTNIHTVFKTIDSHIQENKTKEKDYDEKSEQNAGLILIDWDEWTTRENRGMISSCTGDRCNIQ